MALAAAGGRAEKAHAAGRAPDKDGACRAGGGRRTRRRQALSWLTGVLLAAIWSAAAASAQTTPLIRAAPTTLTFVYTKDAAALPAAQTLTISTAVQGIEQNVVITRPSSPWLIANVLTGRTTLAVKISVNPTSLPIGNFNETLTISVPSNNTPLSVPVILQVKAPPANLTLSASSFDFTYNRDDVAFPANQALSLTSPGGVLTFSAAPKATSWLTATPPTGSVFPGFASAVTLGVDPTGLEPGSYKGSLVINSPSAVTKTNTVNVNFTVQPGTPEVTSLWPPRLPIRGADAVVTIRGRKFFAGTTVNIGDTSVKITVIGSETISMQVPASLQTLAANLRVTVTNPGTGGGAVFTTLPVASPGPLVASVVNAASQRTNSMSPGSMFTIYGMDLGPDTLQTFAPGLLRVPTTLDSTRVLVNNLEAPIIYLSKTQIAAITPYGVDVTSPVSVTVERNAVRSNTVMVTGAAASPGLFTADGTGTGLVACNVYDDVKQSYFLMTDSNPAKKGDLLILYATGEGFPVGYTNPGAFDGLIATGISPSNNSAISVLFGTVPGDILYTGPIPGLSYSIIQINVRVPASALSGKSVPITLRVNNALSPTGTVVSIK